MMGADVWDLLGVGREPPHAQGLCQLSQNDGGLDRCICSGGRYDKGALGGVIRSCYSLVELGECPSIIAR